MSIQTDYSDYQPQLTPPPCQLQTPLSNSASSDTQQQEIEDQIDSFCKSLKPHQLQHSPLNRFIVVQPLSHQIQTSLKSYQAAKVQSKRKDKSQRATVQLVIDPRTRLLLLKMVQQGLVHRINGCISTGKEANVYHAERNTQQFALKIFKTSILVFKDRERYVQGQFRFRRGYCSSNPRKMVKMWAQKELRNLKRIQGKIKAPVPIQCKNNIILMSFVGKNLQAAPRLQDTQLDQDKYNQLYLSLMRMMRVLYQQCKLVHADLSQYNLLYYQGELVMIDMSHAVEHDHLYSLQFLKRDILNINNYFAKKKKVFNFITDLAIINPAQRILELITEHQLDDCSQDDQEQAFFAQKFIPRTLDQLSLQEIQRDLQKRNHQYDNLIGVVQQNDSQSDSQENSEQIPQDQKQKLQKKGGKQKYEGLQKKQRKELVKQEKRERRKDKMPKHLKKAAIKKAKSS